MHFPLHTQEPDSRGQSHYAEAKRVTIVGAVVDLVLGVSKIAIGTLGHSQGLVADGIHSLSDLVTDFMVLWAAKHGNVEADSDHPYGHERIQTAATVFLGVALIVVALGIALDAVDRLINPESLQTPRKLTIVIAAISIIAKEWIYHYTIRVARRTRSALLKANAWHSRSDALSSVVVLVGIVGSIAGLTYLDSVAAVIVAAMIVRVGWHLGWDSVQELIDTGLDKTLLEKMRQTMLAVDGVRGIHRLRTRRMAHQVVADVHVMVEPLISVSEGHRISEEVERAFERELDDDTDITVHIDPEEDEFGPPALLPLRGEIVPPLLKQWSELCDIPVDHVVLHYLERKVEIELHLSAQPPLQSEILQQRIKQLRELYAEDTRVGQVNAVVSAT
ncbi:MAG: cation diffusion facilitator family transporter [bacterium]